MSEPYACVVADPPWHFAIRSPKGGARSASQHYNTMTLQQIKALPVADWCARDAVLLLWAIDPMLPEALETMRAWGFTFKTVGFCWAKLNRDGSPFCGMGYWSRANQEVCLLGTRGKPKRVRRDVRRLILAPRREHSRKPDEFYARAARLCSGPYLDLFSRQARPGWSQFGNETRKFDEPTGLGGTPSPTRLENIPGQHAQQGGAGI